MHLTLDSADGAALRIRIWKHSWWILCNVCLCLVLFFQIRYHWTKGSNSALRHKLQGSTEQFAAQAAVQMLDGILPNIRSEHHLSWIFWVKICDFWFMLWTLGWIWNFHANLFCVHLWIHSIRSLQILCEHVQGPVVSGDVVYATRPQRTGGANDVGRKGIFPEFPKNLPNINFTALHFLVLQFWKKSSPCLLRHASHVIDFPRFSNQGPLQGASLRQSRFGLTVEAHGAMSRKWVLRFMAGLWYTSKSRRMCSMYISDLYHI